MVENCVEYLIICVHNIPTGIYLLKLTVETIKQGVKYVFIVNLGHISYLALVFLLLILNM